MHSSIPFLFLRRALAAGLVAAAVAACGGGVSLGSTSADQKQQGQDGGTATDGGAVECTKDKCGPMAGAPAEQCADGSIGGNTGRCIDKGGGVCGWEFRTCPTAPACFDSDGSVLAQYKQCNTVDDCTILTYQQNCCGTMHAEGLSASTAAKIKTCTDARTAGFPGCGCAAFGTTADDGSQAADSTTKPTVSCTNQRCITSFGGCPGKTLPPCPRECAQFPETGACTAGDVCRLQGSKIGDECTCGADGTWACSPHPPLGPGCNLVCQ